MRSTYALSLLVSLGCFKLNLADSVLTMPWVGFASSGNYWRGYEGRVIGENGDTTTYAINCPPASDKTACLRFQPDATLIAAPSSYDFIESNYGLCVLPRKYVLLRANDSSYTSTGCTFIGSPTPTTATCSYSQSWHFRSSTVTRDETYVIPGTDVREIVSATLTVAGTGPYNDHNDRFYYRWDSGGHYSCEHDSDGFWKRRRPDNGADDVGGRGGGWYGGASIVLLLG
ncbi:hypothetical protein KXV92_003682 [Aspergillus fumigatus]|nr:hypothetical protein KXX42_004080 [Aspergillus fumigatus]KAH1977068.1 hypothetical protein KXW88_008557 [Aspergillus fumigatus]KAH3190245.1 hypothetical protein KXV92_003682 [Aspergillus fumigatus]